MNTEQSALRPLIDRCPECRGAGWVMRGSEAIGLGLAPAVCDMCGGSGQIEFKVAA